MINLVKISAIDIEHQLFVNHRDLIVARPEKAKSLTARKNIYINKE